MKHFIFLMTIIFGYKSFSQVNREIKADLESQPIRSANDAADDSAIWYNAKNPEKSLIVASHKKNGIIMLNLNGEIVFHNEKYAINNIDYRPFKGIDLFVASSKIDNSLILYQLIYDPQLPTLKELFVHTLDSSIVSYGVCLFYDQKDNRLFSIVPGKKGKAYSYEIIVDKKSKNVIQMKKFNSFEVLTQAEGCVVDDEFQKLYIAEENKGIWKFDFYQNTERKLIVDLETNVNLAADLEGLALYKTKSGNGFLIVSSQGNSEYSVFTRQDNKYLGNFSIGSSSKIDGVTNTDGIEIYSGYLGPQFPYGILIVQDDVNTSVEGLIENQNFKFVRFEKVINSLSLGNYL